MERYDFRTQRLFVDADLGAGAIVEASRAHANYLLNVLRLKSGSDVLVFNGRHGEWLARIEATARKACRLALVRQTRPQPAAGDLHYLFAPLKQSRLDYMVQKAVEMGASVLRPVVTDHTQIHRLNLERLRANIVEAAEQCGILHLPQLCEPEKLGPLIGEWDKTRRLIYCDEAGDEADPLELLKPLSGKPLALLVGPEGGFSASERQLLRTQSFVTVIGLGPRILRADTAAVAALAVVQAAAGDWRNDPDANRDSAKALNKQ